MPKSNKRCTYNEDYKIQFPWVKSVPANKHSAFCIWCLTIIRIDNMGRSALESHEKGKKHLAKLKSRNSNTSMFDYSIESNRLKVDISKNSLLIIHQW